MSGRPITGAVYISLHHPSQRTFALLNIPLETSAADESRNSRYVERCFNSKRVQVGVMETACETDGEVSLLFCIRGHSPVRGIISKISAMVGKGTRLPSPQDAPFTMVTAKIQTHAPIPHTVEEQIVERIVAPGQDYTVHVLAHVKEGGEAWSLVRLEEPFLSVGGKEISLEVLNHAPWLEEKRVGNRRSWGGEIGWSRGELC